jgi:D-arabinose 1-dehydrogenase-like Zn-dependent alcohol dehydrogenase
MHVRKGTELSIIGAAGGGRGYTVQLARERGAEIAGTARSENRELARSYGADAVLDSYAMKCLTARAEAVNLVMSETPQSPHDALVELARAVERGALTVRIASWSSSSRPGGFNADQFLKRFL